MFWFPGGFCLSVPCLVEEHLQISSQPAANISLGRQGTANYQSVINGWLQERSGIQVHTAAADPGARLLA